MLFTLVVGWAWAWRGWLSSKSGGRRAGAVPSFPCPFSWVGGKGLGELATLGQEGCLEAMGAEGPAELC